MIAKLILFDFDGTLADSFGATLAVGNRMAEKYGYSRLSEAEALSLRHQGMRQILRQSSISIRRIPSWIREFRQEMRQEIPHLKAPPGLNEALIALRSAGIPLGIVTSNSQENVRLFLQGHGWTDWFDYIESGSSLFGKSRLIKRVLRRAGLPAGQTFYVGDEERDVEAARQAKVSPIAVSWGFNSREILTRSQPDHLLDHPADLPRLFAL